jgi:branched-subunit amino acid ABC-type transport system permease component
MRSTQLVILLSTTVIMVLLTLLIKFTRIGKAMRATAQDRSMAMLVGVNVNQVISMTFVIGSGLAAVGGVLIASHIGQINFFIGFIAGIKAFTAAVLGGIGSIPGCFCICAAGINSDFQTRRASGKINHAKSLVVWNGCIQISVSIPVPHNLS